MLAGFDVGVEAVERGFLGVVLLLDRRKGLGQCRHVQSGALRAELFAATVGIQDLPVQVFDAGAFDVAGTRGFGLRLAVRIPALLPVGQRGFGIAPGVLALAIIGLQA